MTDVTLAKKLLLQHYGLAARLQPLPGDRDYNFAVELDTGERRVLKIMHRGCPAQLVALQCAALARTASAELDTPRVIPNLQGADYSVVHVGTECHILWLLSWLPGVLLADFRPHSDALYHSFGASLGQLNNCLQGFEHPAMHRKHHWQLTEALNVLPWVEDIRGETRDYAQAALQQFTERVQPQLPALPAGVIHNDANDYNVLVSVREGDASVCGLFDFGDMGWQPLVCDVAIALAYLILDKPDPLTVCAQFLRGYHQQRPLLEQELAVLLDLVRTRLAVSIAISSHRQLLEPDNHYLTISQRPAIVALDTLAKIAPRFAVCVFRRACGFEALVGASDVLQYLARVQASAVDVIAVDQYRHLVDLSIGSPMLGADPANARLVPLTRLIAADMAAAGVSFAFGRYAEPRGIYQAPAFGGDAYPAGERRTEHLGIDIFCSPGTVVRTPLEATVELVANNAAPLDYGPLVILRHTTDQGRSFFSLYGHLQASSISELQPGARLAAGTVFAAVGEAGENGGWTPHLHLQLILDLLDLGADFPGVAHPGQSPVWREVCPNPALLFPGQEPAYFDGQPGSEGLRQRRQQHLSDALSLSYQQPLHIVRGWGQFLYDSEARGYLDCYNNVAHLGHSHPRVVAAVQRQIALLNTNTRYLHENILTYAERLTATLPASLQVCYFVNSASEANELALRLARTYTGAKDMCVVAGAYHGHTSSLVELSPYKYRGPGGLGPVDWVHEAPLADDYRGPYRRDNPEAAALYVRDLARVMDAAIADGRRFAGFIAESLPSVSGQIILPPGYLADAYTQVRARGGVCIADEVQVGFGRLGDCFWGFEGQHAVPDIVVLGKPIANGFPLGAVITTRAIADAFSNGMEFFSTYGGNPVACAAGLAVLDVIAEEQLQANARDQGAYLLHGLQQLQARHPVIGDTRGQGLFLGIELVRNPDTLEPAATEASYLVNRLRDHYILTGTDGLHHNVVKLRPPMTVSRVDLDYLLEALDAILSELRHWR